MDSDGKRAPGAPTLPERSFRDLSLQGMTQTFALNTFGPVLFFKAFAELLKPRACYRNAAAQGPPVMAALSARVGSMGDNFKGGTAK